MSEEFDLSESAAGEEDPGAALDLPATPASPATPEQPEQPPATPRRGKDVLR